MTGEHGSLGEREARGERRPDERMPEVVEADGLAVVVVEARVVSRGVNGTKRVPSRLRLASGGREHERVAVDKREVSACRRYAPGTHCEIHGGHRTQLPRPITAFERTAYHEAGHKAVAEELGWPVVGVSIVPANGYGRCAVLVPELDSLRHIEEYIAFSLAGPIAASMAKREDWRTLNLDRELAHENTGSSFGDLNLAARNVRFGDDFRGAYDWLSQQASEAGERAYRILERNWTDVAYTARRLLGEHAIGAA